jgi:hypothetical protein
MPSHFTAEQIANWASDFTGSDQAGLFPAEVQAVAGTVLETLLNRACDGRGIGPEAITEDDLKTAMLTGVAKLALPEDVLPYVPSLCRSFLADLQNRGRLGQGETLGRYVGALKAAYLDAARPVPATFIRPGAKIGRNDPCLCGSGKKYKHCCGQ